MSKYQYLLFGMFIGAIVSRLDIQYGYDLGYKIGLFIKDLFN